MGFIANVSNTSSSSNGFPELPSFGNEQSELDKLIQLGANEGGAVGEVIQELTQPKRSMLSTIGTGFKNAFNEFTDIISTGGQVVAGILSPDLTIKEAVQQDVLPSDVLLKEPDPEATGMEKVGEFFVRTAVDILLDPITYVSFGASAGVFGIRALPKVKAGTNIATKIGVEEGTDVALSAFGKTKMDRFLAAQRNGMRQTFLKNERIGLINAAKKSGKAIDEDGIAKKLAEIEAKTSDELIERTLNARLGVNDAKKTISKMLERNPALAETWIDKGGIKFFGKSLLSGQRIRGLKAAIPGVTLLDNATQPVRNLVGGLFNPDFTLSGKLPEEFLSLESKLKDLAKTRQTDFLERSTQLFKKLNLSREETELITAAIEANKRPADAQLAAVWDTLNGLAPDPSIIREEVLTAAGFVKSQLQKNLDMLRSRGLPVHEMQNYLPHYLVKEPLKKAFRQKKISPFSTRFKESIPAAQFAKIGAFIDDANERLIGFAKQADEGLEVNVANEAGEQVDKLKLSPTDDVDVFTDINGKEFKRVRASVEEAKRFGVNFEDNAVAVMMRNSLESIQASVSTDFITEMSSTLGIRASKAPKGFRKIDLKSFDGSDFNLSDFVTSKNGEDILFHPEVAKRLESFVNGVAGDEATTEFFKHYDKLQNIFKASVTSIFPAFHGRNAYSNVFLHFLDLGLHSVNPANHVASANMLWKNREFNKLTGQLEQIRNAPKGSKTLQNADEVQEKLFNLQNEIMLEDSTGYKWSFGELRRVIQENVVGFNPDIVGAIDVTRTTSEVVEGLSDDLFSVSGKAKAAKIARQANPLSLNFAPFKVGRRVGNAVEEQARILDFMVNLRKTGDVNLAARRTKQFLFDYQNLTQFERKVMRRIIPFYTFTRKNLELQTKTLFSAPGRINAELAAVATIGDVMSQASLTEEERQALPEWIRDGITVLKKREGDNVELFANLGTPIEQPFEAFQPNTLLGSVSPLLRVPVEQASGYSFFHGKGLSEITNAAAFEKAPDAVKDFIGFTTVTGTRRDGSTFEYSASLRPERMHFLLNLPPTSRVLSSLRQMQTVDVSGQSKILQQLVGLKAFNFDLVTEAERREKELQKQIEKVLATANVGFQFEKFIVPNDNPIK